MRSRASGAGLLRAVISLIAAAAIVLGQDLTVEWKTSLSDLERRLPGLTGAGGAGVEAWRSDAEALRSSISSSLSANSQVEIPAALPLEPSHLQLEQQLNALKAAVEEIGECFGALSRGRQHRSERDPKS